jgi:hypothetical protein
VRRPYSRVFKYHILAATVQLFSRLGSVLISIEYENVKAEYHARGRWEMMLLELIVLLVRSGRRLKWLLLAERSVAVD